MEFPEKSTSCDTHKHVSTQTSGYQACPGAIHDICGLCGKRGLSDSDEITIGGSLPDNVCQCFFFSDINASEANVAVEQEADSPTTEIYDSPDVNLRPVPELSYVEAGKISMKDFVNSSEESNIPEFSLSSNNIEKMSHVQNLASCRSITFPRSGKNYRTSPNTEMGNVSSGYALSLHDQSSDQINFTSPSSGGDSKRSSLKETSPLSGYAMSMGEQSFDRNFRNLTTSSSAEESKSSPDVDKGKHGAEDLSKSNTDSKLKNNRSRQTSPTEQGHRNIKQLRAGEHNYSQSVLEAFNGHLKQNIKSEYKSNQSSPSKQEHSGIKQQRDGEHSTAKTVERDTSNELEQYVKDNISQDMFRFENQNIRFATFRPPLPRPFPNCSHSHQPGINPAINIPASTLPQPYTIPAVHMPAATPHQPFINTAISMPVQMHQPYINHPMRILTPTPHQPYTTTAMNMPIPTTYSVSQPQQYLRTFNISIIPTNIPGRFPVTPRPQTSALYHRPNSEGSGSLSKKSLQEVERMDLSGKIINKDENIHNWIESVNNSINSGDRSLTPEWDSLLLPENEVNEGQFPDGPGFPETTTDERSSTEKSEEENRRQRSMRRPPRSRKK